MLATDKQINYLCSLAEKVEKLKVSYPQVKVNVVYIDWKKERSMGVTTSDASARISAYKTAILGIKLSAKLLGI